MAKFILARFDETPLDHLSSAEIGSFIAKANVSSGIDITGEITSSEKRKLLRDLVECPISMPGHFISLKQALDMMEAFDDHPNSLSVSSGTIDDFITILEQVKKDYIPAGNIMGLRFYFGFNNSNEYSIIVLPMYGISPLNFNINSHKEKLLLDSFGFFALAPSLKKISNDKVECGDLIKNTDPTGKRLAYFSYSDFYTFYEELTKKSFKELRFSFARCSDKLTIILTGFDVDGNPVIINTGKAVAGICFDQGDLIPPPSTVPDTNF